MSQSYNEDIWSEIPGWMAPEAAQLMEFIAKYDDGSGVLEFGVYKAKLLALAATLFSGPTVGVDAMWNGLNNPLTGHDLQSAINEVTTNVRNLSGREIELIVSDTTRLKASDIAPHAPSGFFFISVDAGHDPDPVFHDLDLAASLLKRGGVIFLDDGFNSACPGVGEGMFRFLFSDKRLKPFATGYNKTLLTDAASHGLWRARIEAFLDVGSEALCERSRTQRDANKVAKWTPTMCGSEVTVFV